VKLTIQQQQDYIQAMDIDPWFPRVKLKNSPPALLLTEKGEGFLEPANSDGSDVVAGDVLDLKATLQEVVRNTPAETKKSDKSEQSNVALSEKPIKFGMGLYVYGDWLIASSLSSGYQSMQEPASRLIISILRTLGDKPCELKYHHVISWPFFSNPNSSQGKSAAQQYVNGVIEHLVEEHEVKRILVLGGVLAKLNDWIEIEGADFGSKRLVIPSVYRMLEDPSEKRKAWTIIKSSSFFGA
jgi:hypothetical protein